MLCSHIDWHANRVSSCVLILFVTSLVVCSAKRRERATTGTQPRNCLRIYRSAADNFQLHLRAKCAKFCFGGRKNSRHSCKDTILLGTTVKTWKDISLVANRFRSHHLKDDKDKQLSIDHNPVATKKLAS